MINRVGSVTLEVPNLADSVRFFEEKVGLVTTENDGKIAFLRSGAGHHDMILVQSDRAKTALISLNFEVVAGTFEETLSQAMTGGAIDCGAVNHPGIARAHLLEIPGGFAVKIYEGMVQVGAPPASSLPRPIRFSHFNIGVEDVAAHVTFFQSAFGLRVSDWIGDEEDPFISWLHCPVPGASHHGVAVLKSERRRLHHIAFDYGNVTDVVDLVDNYVDQEHYLVWGMGRHGTGGSLFSYIEDPSGMMVELGTGMIIIGEDDRWTGPQQWSMDDQRGVDEWGSGIPDAWLAKHVDVETPRRLAS